MTTLQWTLLGSHLIPTPSIEDGASSLLDKPKSGLPRLSLGWPWTDLLLLEETCYWEQT